MSSSKNDRKTLDIKANKSIKMQMGIHPKIWKQVEKMYDHYYDDDNKIRNVLLSLQLNKDASGVTRYTLLPFLESLPFDDGIKILW